MYRKHLIRRSAGGVLALALLLATPAAALPEGDGSAQGAPIARELEIRTYRGIPCEGQFLSMDPEGEDVTYRVETEPKKGDVTVEGSTFVYTPEKNKTGTDRFTYVAEDSAGNVSAPAAVSVTIEKTKSGVTYADTGDSASAAAAQDLAERGVFVGAKLGDDYFFEPERTVSRGEFLAMTMKAAGLEASEVTMTGFCDDAGIPAWAKSYAAAGLSEGVVRGTATAEGVAFRAEDPVTFNEAAAMLDRVLSVSDVDLAVWYADRAAAPSWAAQAVGNMESVNVLAAGSFGSDALNEHVTRADAARMISAAATLLDGEPQGLLAWLAG